MLKWFGGFNYLEPAAASIAILASRGWVNPVNFGVASNTALNGNAMAFNGGGSPGSVTQEFGHTYGSGYLGFALNATAGVQVSFRDIQNGLDQFYISFDASGLISVWLATTPSPQQIYQTSNASWITGVRQYVEIFAQIGTPNIGTPGAVTVKVGGTTIFALTGLTTQVTPNISFGGFQLRAPASATAAWTDFYFCDPTGTINNSFLGNSTCTAQLPAHAGASTQWLASTSDPNWKNAADTAISGALVYSNTPGQTDLYETQGSIGDVPVIGVQVLGLYANSDSIPHSAQNNLISGVTPATTAARSIAAGASYAFQTDGPYETDPATSAVWAAGAVNAIQIGPTLVS